MTFGREWAIADEDFKALLHYCQEIDRILEQARMRDVRLVELQKTPKEILDGARLRDPAFKKKPPEVPSEPI